MRSLRIIGVLCCFSWKEEKAAASERVGVSDTLSTKNGLNMTKTSILRMLEFPNTPKEKNGLNDLVDQASSSNRGHAQGANSYTLSGQ